MIWNIVFDMGQVLIYFRPDSFLNRYEISDEEKQLLKREVFGSMEWPLLDWGALTDEQALERMKPRIPASLHEIAGNLVRMWDRPIEPVQGMADLIRDLKEAGYGIYLLSNASFRHPDYWGRIPGSEYFDGLVISAFEHMVKPNPDIYRCLLDRYDLRPEECVFIDDMPTNVAGAYVAGMDGIVFRGVEELRNELEKRGVNPGNASECCGK
ncbi:MAG: HAD family phosphatase [Lachnospiraceae bacterium]|nr:HAD family phosphatase [Lachnospiraceae bacterium]